MNPEVRGRGRGPVRRSADSLRRAGIALTVPALLMTISVAGSGQAAADSPGRHTGGLITVGMPNRTVAGVEVAGAVDLYPRTGARQVLTMRALGFTGRTAERFGASITMADLDHDQRTDLLIGAPGSPSLGQSGRVIVVFQAASGQRFPAKNARIIKGPGLAGDLFGTAIAISPRSSDDQNHDIWVGAPGQDVSTGPDARAASAGAVHHFVAGVNGELTAAGQLVEGDGVIPGPAEADDLFGLVLASALNGVVIGVPTKEVDGVSDAGQIVRVRTDPDTQALLPAQVINENSPGIPGTAEASDHFGAAVTEHGYAVGIPQDRVDSLWAAGAVQTFVDDPATPGQLLPATKLTQNSPGIPGVAEAGDRFGAALSQNIFHCRGVLSLAIGSPDENLARKKNTGSVTLVALRPTAGEPPALCPSKVLAQGHGLPGRPNRGDRLGAAVSSIGGPERGDATHDTLLIGIPGEDVRRIGNTGRAVIAHPTGRFARGFGAISGDRYARSYGAVFGTEAADL